MASKTKSKKFIYKEGITKKYEVLKEAMKYLSPITLDVPQRNQSSLSLCVSALIKQSPGML